MIKAGDILEGTVLEVKEKSVILKFGTKAIEASSKTDLKVGEKIKVKIQGWHKGRLLLKVLDKPSIMPSNSIDLRV
ncbi:hypothetical protein [Orenia marismortui]|uniref:S1 motif domain-containing protein n=1 Tax=Orenia marismortui TaxID=46469 RepID=A0A4R8GZ93_9FIRM|nr:hypothetical protein [Orenia marismortui]TDX51957.1 hypothetical protein C7959_10981 [Orenia marismortui]